MSIAASSRISFAPLPIGAVAGVVRHHFPKRGYSGGWASERVMIDSLGELDDAALSERLRSGDRDALATLYDRYAPLAMGVAMRVVHDRTVAEDVVQDAFVTVWQKIARYDGSRGSLRGWLITVVRNRAIDRVRATRATVDVDAPEAEALLRTGPNPTSDDALERVTAEAVRQALIQLPDDQRTAIQLAYFEGYTYREIADLTGVPRGTASGRLRLALGKLRDSLRGSSAAPLMASSTDRTTATEVDR